MAGRPRTGDIAPDGRIYIRLDDDDHPPPRPEPLPFDCIACGAHAAGWKCSLTGRPICWDCTVRARVRSRLYLNRMDHRDDLVIADARSVVALLEDECGRRL